MMMTKLSKTKRAGKIKALEKSIEDETLFQDGDVEYDVDEEGEDRLNDRIVQRRLNYLKPGMGGSMAPISKTAGALIKKDRTQRKITSG